MKRVYAGVVTVCTKSGGTHCNMHDLRTAECTVGSGSLRRSVSGTVTSSQSYTIRHGGDTPEWSTVSLDPRLSCAPGAFDSRGRKQIPRVFDHAFNCPRRVRSSRSNCIDLVANKTDWVPCSQDRIERPGIQLIVSNEIRQQGPMPKPPQMVALNTSLLVALNGPLTGTLARSPRFRTEGFSKLCAAGSRRYERQSCRARS